MENLFQWAKVTSFTAEHEKSNRKCLIKLELRDSWLLILLINYNNHGIRNRAISSGGGVSFREVIKLIGYTRKTTTARTINGVDWNTTIDR